MNPTHTSTSAMLTIRRTFAAPRARVFAAWTDVEMLRRWFAPDGRVTEARWDVRKGATYRIAMTIPSGEEYIVGGVFSEVRAPERLAFTFRWEEDDKTIERDTFVTIELLERGTETEMIFTQTDFRDETSRDNHRDGWSQSFDNFARLLAA